MRPLLEQRNGSWRDYIVGETSIGPLSAAIVEERYKSIIFTDHTRLYDLQNDPLEMRDLANDPDHRETLARHRAHLREYIAQIEMYPEPDNVEEMALARGNLYREYNDWYTSVLNEA
jgi:arylsulfatase A-like enzyme